MAEFITVSAKTVEEAVTEASIKLGVVSDHVEYEVVEKGSSGVFGFGSKPAVIRAWEKDEAAIAAEEAAKAAEEAAKAAAAAEAERAAKEAEEKAAKFAAEAKAVEAAVAQESKTETVAPTEEEAPARPKKVVPEGKDFMTEGRAFLVDLLDKMGLESEVIMNYDEAENTVNIEIKGGDMGMLIGKRGQTLDSIQYLVNLVLNRYSEDYVRVKLDTENYRDRRKETLEGLAKRIAKKVAENGRSVSLEPMNPYERRIIHSALQDDKYVYTMSDGEEPYRHVVILLKKDVKPLGSYRRDGKYGYGRSRQGGYSGGRGGYRGGNRNSGGRREYGKGRYNQGRNNDRPQSGNSSSNSEGGVKLDDLT